jgi:hypothetical protein
MNTTPKPVTAENFFYEATEATEAMATKNPLFITGNFDKTNNTADISYFYALLAGGGRGLKIEKEEDVEAVKTALDSCNELGV